MSSDILFNGLLRNRSSWYGTLKFVNHYKCLTSSRRNIRRNKSILHLLRTRPRHQNSRHQILHQRTRITKKCHLRLQRNLNTHLQHLRLQHPHPRHSNTTQPQILDLAPNPRRNRLGPLHLATNQSNNHSSPSLLLRNNRTPKSPKHDSPQLHRSTYHRHRTPSSSLSNQTSNLKSNVPRFPSAPRTYFSPPRWNSNIYHASFRD